MCLNISVLDRYLSSWGKKKSRSVKLKPKINWAYRKNRVRADHLKPVQLYKNSKTAVDNPGSRLGFSKSTT